MSRMVNALYVCFFPWRRCDRVTSWANSYQACEVLPNNLENELKDQEEFYQDVHWIVFLAWWN